MDIGIKVIFMRFVKEDSKSIFRGVQTCPDSEWWQKEQDEALHGENSKKLPISMKSIEGF